MKNPNGVSKYLPTIQQFLTIVAAIAAIASAFVAYKLSPLYALQSELDYRIRAIEESYSRKDTVNQGFDNINKRLDEEKQDFIRLETKIDRLFTR